MPHKMCPRKQTTESFLSGEVTPYTDISYCIHILESMPFRFLWATLYTCRMNSEDNYQYMYEMLLIYKYMYKIWTNFIFLNILASELSFSLHPTVIQWNLVITRSLGP